MDQEESATMAVTLRSVIVRSSRGELPPYVAEAAKVLLSSWVNKGLIHIKRVVPLLL